MARYRCFCMTQDGRIITGAFVPADDASEAMDLARAMWAAVPGFDHAELWLDDVGVCDCWRHQLSKCDAA